jgi:hypothetical protein
MATPEHEHDDHQDGCALDFSEDPTPDHEIEDLLVPQGEEEDEDDAP